MFQGLAASLVVCGHTYMQFDRMVGRTTNFPGRVFLAIGNIAVGALAVGGLAFGFITLGGASFGLAFALGGAAVGLGLSVGGLAIGSVALGGAAIGFVYAIGGGAFGPAIIDGRRCDPAALEFVRQWIGPSMLPPNCR